MRGGGGGGGGGRGGAHTLGLSHAHNKPQRMKPQTLSHGQSPSSTPRSPPGPGPSAGLNPSSGKVPEPTH